MKVDISCQCQKFSARGRNLCQRKKFIVGRKLFSEQKYLSEEGISCQQKKFLSQEAISYWKKIFLVKFSVIERNVVLEEDFYSQMKNCIVTGRELQSQEEIYCRREKFHFRRQNLLSEQELFSEE